MACVNGRDRWTTNMSKHQPFHAAQLCHARDLDRASVASRAASEANGRFQPATRYSVDQLRLRTRRVQQSKVKL
jgi:hypothetical protein